MSLSRNVILTAGFGALAMMGMAAIPAHAGTIIPTGTLNGAYYYDSAATNPLDGNGSGTLITVAGAQSYIASSTPDGTFTASQAVLTSAGYSGTDGSTITDFLGGDASSYTALTANGAPTANKNMEDGILNLTGYVYVPTAGTQTFSLTSDDGSALYIGGTTVVDDDGFRPSTTASGTYDFTSAGYYAVQAIYFNNEYQNGSGTDNFSVGLPAGDSLSTSPAPEPSQIGMLALMGLGLGGLMLRARKAKATLTA